MKTASNRRLSEERESAPLTKRQITELKRRVAEIDDPTRYMVVSAFSKRHVLYYMIESNCYAMNRPEDASLFKNPRVAKAVLAALQTRRGRNRGADLQIITARKTKTGIRLVTKPVGLLDRVQARPRKSK